MKMKVIMVILMMVLILTGTGFAQARQSQFEIFGGVAFPMAPDYFKDYHKMGFSPHVQYVMFPTPRIGVSFGAAYEFFSFDSDKFISELEDEMGESLEGFEVDGGASIVEFTVGVRPYISSPEASNQLFLFGMASYNLMKIEYDLKYEGTSFYKDDANENKFGLGAGAGIEMPAGDRFNVILQGVFRFIFTDVESTNFVGITAGLVF